MAVMTMAMAARRPRRGNRVARRVGLIACLLAACALVAASGTVVAQSSVTAVQVIAQARAGGADVPRIELASRLAAAGFEASDEFQSMRQEAARELAGRPDGVGIVRPAELVAADQAIAREKARLAGAPPPSFCTLAHASGRPQIPGLRIVYLHPLGDPAAAHWHNILAHQTEGTPGSAKMLALAQFARPTRRGVTIWMETDGTVYWSTAETAVTTHGDGGDRNDNKYIDNGPTYHIVNRTNAIGIEVNGNFPDVTKPPTPEQVTAWLILVRFLQERYGIASEHIYAHNWIDYKDSRYCEGCSLAMLARQQAYVPGAACAAVAGHPAAITPASVK